MQKHERNFCKQGYDAKTWPWSRFSGGEKRKNVMIISNSQIRVDM